LNQKFSTYIQDYWEFAKTIEDPEFFKKRMRDGYFYGFIIHEEVVSFIGSLGETKKLLFWGCYLLDLSSEESTMLSHVPQQPVKLF
jgi:hypothetical protein